MYSTMCFLPVAHTLSRAHADRAVLDDEVTLFKCEVVCASFMSSWLRCLSYPFSSLASGSFLPCCIREPFIGLRFMCRWNYSCGFFLIFPEDVVVGRILVYKRHCFHICWHSVPAWHLFICFLPFSLCLLYHLDRVPNQDSGAGTWPWVYLSCAKSWSSPDLPYRQLHQKGVDRMCSCCHRKGKTAFFVTPWCLSTRLPLRVNQSNWIQETLSLNFAF